MDKSKSSGVVVVGNERIRMENPFTLKVGQVFTGFGIGCGIGIGVGRPINLGAIPVLNEVMSAARGATYAFSGATRHVNGAFKKLGAKNIEAGVGCGIGIGHGFGVGVALKPSALRQFQLCVAQTMMKMMVKFGITPELPIGQGALSSSLQGGMSMMSNSSVQNPIGSIMQLAMKLPDQTAEGLTGFGNTSVDTPLGSRTEKVLSSFLQNPVLQGEGEKGAGLRSENDMLHMVLKSPTEVAIPTLSNLELANLSTKVLKHQKVIEELKEENEKLRQFLVEELKVAPEKLQPSYSSKIISPCSDCFECRRKQRKK